MTASTRRLAFGLVAPAAILIGVVLFYPILHGVWMSLFDIPLLGPPPRYVGLSNFANLVMRDDFRHAFKVTLAYTAGTVVTAFGIGFLVAILLNAAIFARPIARTLLLLPWAIPEVVAVLVFAWMLDFQWGVLNYLLSLTGYFPPKIGWLLSPDLALYAVMAVTAWKDYPLAAVMILAGLQGIPQDLYEAARVDGATSFQEFRHITLPGLRPISAVVFLLLTLYSFKRVALIYIMTAGGPSRATETLSVLTYLEGFKFFRMGSAAAIGVAMLAVTLVFTLFYYRFTMAAESAT
ncbi:MAG: sugar ABC transporter permease [bacterium]|nr:sugar ABC transporter permease [bacterium]